MHKIDILNFQKKISIRHMATKFKQFCFDPYTLLSYVEYELFNLLFQIFFPQNINPYSRNGGKKFREYAATFLYLLKQYTCDFAPRCLFIYNI